MGLRSVLQKLDDAVTDLTTRPDIFGATQGGD